MELLERAQLLQKAKLLQQQKQAALSPKEATIDGDAGDRLSTLFDPATKEKFQAASEAIPKDDSFNLARVARSIPNELPALAGGFGEGVAGPPGAFIGGVTGEALKQFHANMTSNRPMMEKLFGVDEDSPKRILDSGYDMAKSGANAFMGAQVASELPGMVKGAGESIYSHAYRPIEEALKKIGKSGLDKVGYEHGIWNMRDILGKLQNIATENMGKVRALYKGADEAGGEVNMEEAMQPVQDYVNAYLKKAGNNPEMQQAAKTMQDRIDMYKNAGRKDILLSKPEVPVREPFDVMTKRNPEKLSYVTKSEKFPTDVTTDNLQPTIELRDTKASDPFSMVKSGKEPLADAEAVINNPVDKVTSLPQQGTSGTVTRQTETLPIQGDLVTRPGPNVTQTAAWKTHVNPGESAYNEFSQTPTGQEFDKLLGNSFKNSVEKEVGSKLGPEYGHQVRKLNSDTGKIIGNLSKRAQAAVENKTERLIDIMSSPFPGGTEGAVSGLSYGVSKDAGHAAGAAILQKALRGLNLLEMPAGYAMQKSAPLMEKAFTMNPWAQQYAAEKLGGD